MGFGKEEQGSPLDFGELTTVVQKATQMDYSTQKLLVSRIASFSVSHHIPTR